jgi:hypothetical protein
MIGGFMSLKAHSWIIVLYPFIILFEENKEYKRTSSTTEKYGEGKD